MNMRGLGVECHNLILGDGRRVSCDPSASHGCREFSPDENGIESITLHKLFKLLSIDSDYVIVKMDCEGGEMSLLGDEDSTKVLQESIYFIGENHFRTGTDDEDRWNKWVKDWFTKTHDISSVSAGTYRGFDLRHFVFTEK
jgi:hypothetical protein